MEGAWGPELLKNIGHRQRGLRKKCERIKQNRTERCMEDSSKALNVGDSLAENAMDSECGCSWVLPPHVGHNMMM